MGSESMSKHERGETAATGPGYILEGQAVSLKPSSVAAP